jgi:hypothetical protein
MMDPKARELMRGNLHLVRDADLLEELAEEHVAELRATAGDNFAPVDDAARVARMCADMGRIAGDAESRSASRALGWWLVALLIVASVAVGMVVGHFAVKALANAAVTVVQAERMEGW